MKKKKYHTVGTLPKSNIKIVEKCWIPCIISVLIYTYHYYLMRLLIQIK